jgi:hypothetical protein
MATDTRNPTSEVAITGTWSGTNRHLLVDDYPADTTGADKTTCSVAGVALFGFTAFAIPAGSTSISVQVLYYDSKNGSSTSACGAAIRCNDTTNRLASSHNPANANFTARSDNYATNPKSSAAWTVNDVNGVGTNGLTSFGLSVTDASPTIDLACIALQVTYTPPAFSGSGAPALKKLTATGAGSATVPAFSGAAAANLKKLTASSSASSTVPAFSGAGAPSLKKVTASGAASWEAGAFSAAGVATLVKLTALGSAASTVPAFSGSAIATLKKLGLTGAATNSVPAFSGAGDASLKKLTACGAAAGTVPAFSPAGDAALRKLTVVSTASGTVPAFSAAVATLAKMSADAAASSTSPDFSAAGMIALKPVTVIAASSTPGSGKADPSGQTRPMKMMIFIRRL